MKNKINGFTLLEMVVSIAIFGIIMVTLLNSFNQGNRVAANTSNRSDMQQEILNAQQLISGRLREAWYIYPPTSTTWSLGTTALTRNPVTGNNSWQTDTSLNPNQPLLALILPPTSPTGPYRFFAYYPVLRSTWLSGTISDPVRDPGADTSNNNTWVLAEYRQNMPSSFNPSAFPTTPPSMPTGATPNILSDYVAPTIVTSNFTTSGNTYTMFTYTTDSLGFVNGVTLNLASSRLSLGSLLRLPNATDEYTISIYPTNLGKLRSYSGG